MRNVVISIKIKDKNCYPLKNVKAKISSAGIRSETSEPFTDTFGYLRMDISFGDFIKLPMPLLLTMSLRGYRIQTMEVLVVAGTNSYNLDSVMDPITIDGFPCENLSFESVCIDSLNKPQFYDDDLIAHPNTCNYRGQYLMLYTARGSGIWGTAAAISNDGINWHRKGHILTPETIDPDKSKGVQNLYTAQPVVVGGCIYVIAGAKAKTNNNGLPVHHLWLFKNDKDPFNPQSWEVVNGKHFMGKEDLWGCDPQDARLYVLNDPPVINGHHDKFWMVVISNPKTHNTIEAQHSMLFSAPDIEGPYSYVKTILSTPSWFNAEWPGSIIQIGRRYYWLSTNAETGALHGEASKGILYWSDDFLTWNKLSGDPFIFPQPYPDFDDIHTGEFEFQLSPDRKKVLVYYAGRSVDNGKKTIACYSFTTNEKNVDLLK